MSPVFKMVLSLTLDKEQEYSIPSSRNLTNTSLTSVIRKVNFIEHRTVPEWNVNNIINYD